MSEVEQKFEAWQLANHPCYTASARQGFEAGFAAGAESMRERAAELCSDLHMLEIPSVAIRALSLTPEKK